MNPASVARQHRLRRLRERSDVRLTNHARRRLTEHGFAEVDVLQAVVDPEQTYSCPEATYGPGRRMFQRGEIALVMQCDQRLVITILPRTQERWEHH